MNVKKALIFFGAFSLIIFGAWLAVGDLRKADGPASVLSARSGNEESIKLSSTSDGSYAPKEIRVKLGAKVRIEGDPETLSGGMDTVIIDEYGIRKVISPKDNIIEFVADKSGTFRIYCANGMGNGKLVVV